jgi:hypothetical protein
VEGASGASQRCVRVRKQASRAGDATHPSAEPSVARLMACLRSAREGTHLGEKSQEMGRARCGGLATRLAAAAQWHASRCPAPTTGRLFPGTDRPGPQPVHTFEIRATEYLILL